MKIFNLSDYVLSSSEQSLLARGLTFAPTAARNPFTLFLDLNRFIKNITVKGYFNIEASKNIASKNTTSPNKIDLNTTSSTFSSIRMDQLELNALADLEDLYTGDLDNYVELLRQHLPTSPPIQHTTFKPKSIFNPTFAKGPFIHSFYQVVYADILRLCQQSTTNNHFSNLTTSELKALKDLSIDS